MEMQRNKAWRGLQHSSPSLQRHPGQRKADQWVLVHPNKKSYLSSLPWSCLQVSEALEKLITHTPLPPALCARAKPAGPCRESTRKKGTMPSAASAKADSDASRLQLQPSPDHEGLGLPCSRLSRIFLNNIAHEHKSGEGFLPGQTPPSTGPCTRGTTANPAEPAQNQTCPGNSPMSPAEMDLCPRQQIPQNYHEALAQLDWVHRSHRQLRLCSTQKHLNCPEPGKAAA